MDSSVNTPPLGPNGRRNGGQHGQTWSERGELTEFGDTLMDSNIRQETIAKPFVNWNMLL